MMRAALLDCMSFVVLNYERVIKLDFVKTK